MSDLLAPVLAEVQHEVDAYWCFVGLMQKTIFVSSPKDCDMDKQLVSTTVYLYLAENFKPFKSNGISHYHQLDQSISVLRYVR